MLLEEGQTVKVDFRETTAFGLWKVKSGWDFQETPMINALLSLCDAETVFWDVGANAGSVSYLVARKAKLKTHYLFEPNPNMLCIAEQCLSPFSGVVFRNMGLSNQTGKMSLTIPEGSPAMAHLMTIEEKDEEGDEFESVKCIDVEVSTGDDLVFNEDFHPPNIIKIDTEGHDLVVMQGLAKVINKYQPVIVFEYIDFSSEEIERAVPSGYSIHSIGGGGRILCDFQRGSGHNAVLLPKGYALPQAEI